MTFRNWQIQRDVSAEMIAFCLEVSTSMVYALCNGHSRPSLSLAFAIEDLTNGSVPARGWVERGENDHKEQG